MLLISSFVIKCLIFREPTTIWSSPLAAFVFMSDGATGRRGALPGLVVHGAARLQAALATQMQTFTADDLAPHDLQAWRSVRSQIAFRQEARCKQFRFPKEPAVYLAQLEEQLLKISLRS